MGAGRRTEGVEKEREREQVMASSTPLDNVESNLSLDLWEKIPGS